MLRIAAALVLILTLCYANTPDRVAWYSARVPGLSSLSDVTNAMAEYGYRHIVNERSEFKSRMSLDELSEADTMRSREVAADLDRYPKSLYKRFHRDYSAVDDAFLYEARVHIFSRDRNISLARQAPKGSAEFRRLLTRAYREQEILDGYFAETLGRSIHSQKAGIRRWLRHHHDPDQFFTSKVAKHLITGISEIRLRFLLLTGFVLLLAVDFWLGARDGRQRENSES
jgi:hypothetical protein